jgi:predicted RNA-binding protein with RPS1 domain
MTVETITLDNVETFVSGVLFAADRELPVVAVTTRAHSEHTWISAAELDAAIAGRAIVVQIETGDVTWRLSDLLPDRLDVFGGALRIWWPGLTANADPYDHPLFLIFNAAGADAVRARVLDAFAVDPPESPNPAPQERSRHGAREVLIGHVSAIDGRRISVRVGDVTGVVVYADVKLDVLASQLQPGQELRVSRAGNTDDGTPRFSTQGLVPAAPASARAVVPQPATTSAVEPTATLRSPSAPPSAATWRRIGEVYQTGDCVRARVFRITDNYLLVELLPGATAIVHSREVAYERVVLRGEYSIGEQVKVLLLSLDADAQRCEASIKRAYGQELRPAVSLRRGDPPFLGDERPAAATVSPARPTAGDATRQQELEQQLANAHAAHAREREELERRLAQAEAQRRMEKEQVAQLRKEKKALEDRLTHLRRRYGLADPFASERDFLAAIRIEHARRCSEDDLLRYPLRKLVVGNEFLARARELEGVDAEKILEVCTEVAMGRCHEIPGRDVHPLHVGEGGPPRYRASDGARAWRCSLQNLTASARRLHWWNLGGSPETIEFASVGVHDDFGIPE